MARNGNREERPLSSEQAKRKEWREGETILDEQDANGHSLPESERDRATAKVTYHFDKAPDTKTGVAMTFVREDGAWKVCSTGPS